MDGTIQMLNDVWSDLVNEVEAIKKHCDDLEGSMVQANNCLNNGISSLIKRVDKLETKYHAIEDCYDALVIKSCEQASMIYNMDKHISFYSQSIVKLENEKVQTVDHRFDNLEQHITGQDDQIKILQVCLAIAKRGCCHCKEDTPKVISCCCFLIP